MSTGSRPTYRDETELQLIERSQAGDPSAVGILLERHYDLMYRVALKYTRNPAAGEDAVQTACVQVLRSIHQFRADARFSTWVSRIVVNSALMMHRKNKRLVFVGTEVNRGADDTHPTPESTVSLSEQFDGVESALRGSREGDYDLFVHRFIGGMSIARISEETGLSIGAIKTRFHRARHLLRSEMQH
jgi:RNA polymerase sigma-70 factor (ECF subfamily)